MAVKIEVEVFWVVTPCSVVVGYLRFRSPRCLHLTEKSTTTLHGVTTQIPRLEGIITLQNYKKIYSPRACCPRKSKRSSPYT